MKQLKQRSQKLGGKNIIDCHSASVLELFEEKGIVYCIGTLPKDKEPVNLERLETIEQFWETVEKRKQK